MFKDGDAEGANAIQCAPRSVLKWQEAIKESAATTCRER
jgi:hypothetical protein